MVTRMGGSNTSIVRRNSGEQAPISEAFGGRFAPVSDLGLQRTALVMKTLSGLRPAIVIRWRKVRPELSPLMGMRVLSAPFRPGASAMKRTFACNEPFKGLRTAERETIPGQSEQAAASAQSCVNSSARDWSVMLVSGEVGVQDVSLFEGFDVAVHEADVCEASAGYGLG